MASLAGIWEEALGTTSKNRDFEVRLKATVLERRENRKTFLLYFHL